MANWNFRIDPPNRIIKFANAANADSWPKAASTYICIFEAINQAGSALFGDQWSGKELLATFWKQSPRDFLKYASENFGGGALGGGKSGMRGGGSPVSSSSVPVVEGPPQHNAHVHEWRLEKSQAEWVQERATEKRLRDTVAWLAQLCRDGLITSYARFRAGGGLWPMAAYEWNVDDPLSKFVIEGGHKRYFRDIANPASFDVFLFFSRAELAAAFDRMGLTTLAVAEIELSKLSPYIQLAVQLALQKGYFSKDKCETLAVREAEIRTAWPVTMADIPMSENAVKLIARLMAFPDPVSIQQGSKAHKAKSG